MLAIKAADSAVPLTIGKLAAELLLRHHSTVELVDRLEQRSLAMRVSGGTDGRCVGVVLTPTGERMIAKLASTHRNELARIGPELRRVLGILRDESTSPPRAA